MRKLMSKKTMFSAIAACGLVGLLSACGGGGGGAAAPADSGGGAASATGIGLPSEISAVSADNSGNGASRMSLGRALKGLAAKAAAVNVPSDSDYATTETVKYVDEPALEVFGTVETVLKAVAQTKYADAANVGADPYKAMVAWEEEMDGKTQKSLQEWTVKSVMTTENGADVNILSMWMSMEEEDIKAQMKIYTAPEQDPDGNYRNYGEWTLNAQFIVGGQPAGGFWAEADITADGLAKLSLVDSFMEEEDINGAPVVMKGVTKAVMYRSATQGYGKVIDVNWDYCWNIDWSDPDAESPCVAEAVGGVMDLNAEHSKNIQYAYDQDYFALRLPDGTVYKDRNDKEEMARRYGVFRATDGKDVTKLLSFGFPVRFEVDGSNMHAYYGAWQGRHQLWAPGGTLPDNTSVTKEDVAPGETAPTYTTQTFQGALTKRILTSADLDQIKGVPVEIWLNDFFFLIWDGAQWEKCADMDMDWGATPLACQAGKETAYDMSNLAFDPNTDRKNVWVGRWDMGGEHRYAYNDDAGQLMEIVNNVPQPYVPAGAGEMVNVNIGGSIYIQYTGDFNGGAQSGWIEKTLTSFDRRTWTPTFADGGAEYAFPFNAVGENRELYINNKGTNFVVKRTNALNAETSYNVKMELQQVVNPENTGTLVTGGWTFKEPWNDQGGTYRLNTTAGHANYLMLEYAVADEANNKAVGDRVEKDIWGLAAYSGAVQVSAGGAPVQFNWEYADAPGDWGSVTYLKNGADYVLLDDPLTFNSIELTNVGGDSQNYALQFDGWMHGLPDMHSELQKNGFRMTDEIKNKIVNIPAGTELTASQGGAKYYVKPLEVGVVLAKLDPAPAGAPNVNQANGIDLTALPDPLTATVDIGAKSNSAVLKYVEGKAVE